MERGGGERSSYCRRKAARRKPEKDKHYDGQKRLLRTKENKKETPTILTRLFESAGVSARINKYVKYLMHFAAV